MLQVLTAGLSQQRQVRIAVSALFFLTGFCFFSWATRIPDIQQKLHLSEGQLGGLLLALPIGSLLSMPVAGAVVGKYGSRQVLLVAGALYGLLLPTLGLANETWILFACLVAFGFCGNIANIAVNTQAVYVEEMYGRSVMASFHGLWSTGGLTGSLLAWGMQKWHVQPFQHFLISMVVVFLVLAFNINHVVRHDVKTSEEKQPLFVWPDKFLMILGIIAFCSMICEGAMFDWSGVYFRKVIHVNIAVVGTNAFMSTMATFRFLADYLKLRFGVKRVLQLSGVLIAGGLLLAILMPHFYTAIAGFLMVGAGVSSVVPLVYSAAGKSNTMTPGMALAAVSTIGYLGFLFGPVLIGLVAQVSSLRASFFIIALMGLSIAVMGKRVKN
jgi:MFS family permease